MASSGHSPHFEASGVNALHMLLIDFAINGLSMTTKRGSAVSVNTIKRTISTGVSKVQLVVKNVKTCN